MNPPIIKKTDMLTIAPYLVPDIGAFLDTTQPQTGTGDANASATSLRDAVLTGLPGAEDWVAVEEMYQDEVWGGHGAW